MVSRLIRLIFNRKLPERLSAWRFRKGVCPGDGCWFTLDDSAQQAACCIGTRRPGCERRNRSWTKRSGITARGRALKAQNISASDWDTLLKFTRQQYAAQVQAAQEDILGAEAQLGYTRLCPVKAKPALKSLVQPGQQSTAGHRESI